MAEASLETRMKMVSEKGSSMSLSSLLAVCSFIFSGSQMMTVLYLETVVVTASRRSSASLSLT